VSGLVERFSRLTAGSASLSAGAGFAISGAAFAIGNILLARQMPVAEYGKVGLVVALYIIVSFAAPLGIDQLLLRRRIDPSIRLFGRLVGQAYVVAMIAGLVAGTIYDVGSVESLLLVLAIGIGSLGWVVAAGYRSHLRPLPALLAATASDWLLLGIGVAALFVPMNHAVLPLSLYCGGIALSGLAGWWFFARTHRVAPDARESITWGAAMPLLGVSVAGVFLVQMERILIPAVLDVHSLAMFNVLASVAIFPFRMVTSGAGFALVPQLRAAKDALARRRLVWHELRMIVGALCCATLAVAVFAPHVAQWLTAGRYAPGVILVLLGCLDGASKVAQVIPRAVVTACGTEYDLVILNRLVWAGIAAGTIGAVAGSFAGLGGLLFGVAVGNFLGAVPSAALAWRTLSVAPRVAAVA
jgi:hypothetical protein